jgi:NADH-quinone oxidoreductase subunit H
LLPRSGGNHTVTPASTRNQIRPREESEVPLPLAKIEIDFVAIFWLILPILIPIVAASLLIGFLLVSAVFSVWLERKVAGRIQDRLGPTRVGGKFGWLQTLADGVKLLVKEDLIPDSADHMLFRLGPYIALAGSFLAFIALPFSDGLVAVQLNIGILFMLAIMSTEVFGIILIGYGSGSKWSLFGGMREAAQMVSYEIPMALCILVPVIATGSMNLQQLGDSQQGVWTWNVFRDPFTFLAFWTYYTCAMASCKRAPFDLAEAESELVAGFHTEYSGFRWLVIFMAEYGSMFAVSGIAVLVFLGGWGVGLPWKLSDMLQFGETFPAGYFLAQPINVVIFILKCWFLVFIMMWVRWTLPRLRIDQVMILCWKYIVPISCTLILGVSLWNLVVPAAAQTVVQIALFGLSAFALGMFVIGVVTLVRTKPGTAMAGMYRSEDVTGYQATRQVRS